VSGYLSLKQRASGTFVSLLLAVLAPTVTAAQEPPPRPFLRKVIQLDDAQLAAVERGEVVTKLLPTTDKPEIAAFGVVKTAGTWTSSSRWPGTCKSSGRCRRSRRWPVSRPPPRSRT